MYWYLKNTLIIDLFCEHLRSLGLDLAAQPQTHKMQKCYSTYQSYKWLLYELFKVCILQIVVLLELVMKIWILSMLFIILVSNRNIYYLAVCFEILQNNCLNKILYIHKIQIFIKVLYNVTLRFGQIMTTRNLLLNRNTNIKKEILLF